MLLVLRTRVPVIKFPVTTNTPRSPRSPRAVVEQPAAVDSVYGNDGNSGYRDTCGVVCCVESSTNIGIDVVL